MVHWNRIAVLAAVMTAAFLLSCAGAPESVTIIHKNIQLNFDKNMHSQVVARFGEPVALGDYTASEYPVIAGTAVNDFVLKSHAEKPISDALGGGQQHTLISEAAGLQKEGICGGFSAGG